MSIGDLMMTTKLHHLGGLELTNLTRTSTSLLDRRGSRIQPARDALFISVGTTP